MALIICPECGRKISDRAVMCPGCGIGQDEIQRMIAEKTKCIEKEDQPISICEIQNYPTVSIVGQIVREQLSAGSCGEKEKEEPLIAESQEDDQKINESAYKKGDVIRFGKFKNNPMEWIVLDKDDDKILILLKCALETRQYHSVEKAPVTWDTCELRRYLNGNFISKCFDLQEQKMIVESVLVNHDNSEYGTPGGKNTKDKVFLLSQDEATQLFGSDEERKYMATEYIRKNTFLVVNRKLGTCEWWLRTPGFKNELTVIVNAKGHITKYGSYNTLHLFAVRPAMWVRIG